MKRFCDKCGKTNREGAIIHLNLQIIDLSSGLNNLFGSKPLEEKYRPAFQKLSLEGIDLCEEHFLNMIEPNNIISDK